MKYYTVVLQYSTNTSIAIAVDVLPSSHSRNDDGCNSTLSDPVVHRLFRSSRAFGSIEEVLLDIDRLTSPSPIHDEGQTTTSSVYVKQQALIDELGQWRHIFQPNRNETTT